MQSTNDWNSAGFRRFGYIKNSIKNCIHAIFSCVSVQCLIIRANTRGIIITMEKIAPFFMKMEKPQKLVSSFSCSAIDLINDCSRMLDTALYSKPPKREERELYSNGPWKYSFHWKFSSIRSCRRVWMKNHMPWPYAMIAATSVYTGHRKMKN